jgi:hypothetical protein
VLMRYHLEWPPGQTQIAAEGGADAPIWINRAKPTFEGGIVLQP